MAVPLIVRESNIQHLLRTWSVSSPTSRVVFGLAAGLIAMTFGSDIYEPPASTIVLAIAYSTVTVLVPLLFINNLLY